MDNLAWGAVHSAARLNEWPDATAAALAVLELAEPETLTDALALTKGQLDRGLIDYAVRAAWPTYHHDAGSAGSQHSSSSTSIAAALRSRALRWPRRAPAPPGRSWGVWRHAPGPCRPHWKCPKKRR